MKPHAVVVMLGPFPPPLHGVSAMNAAVRDSLAAAGGCVRSLDVAGSSLSRSLPKRLGRMPKAIGACLCLIWGTHRPGDALYMSISGGLGQLYEVAFVVCARLRRLRLFLHHHSYAYLDKRMPLPWLIVRLSGRSAVHIALSQGMADRLRSVYSARRVVAISNSAFLPRPGGNDRRRSSVHVLGLMSNLSAEKGVFEFLDLVREAGEKGIQVSGRLAGPFQDAEDERRARAYSGDLTAVHYAGPLYGPDKEQFFSDIDVFVFPTRYQNEAEPVVIHEAMARGIPVIAYARGSIPEMVGADAGLVIDPAVPFVPVALGKIREWIDDPSSYRRASRAAMTRFAASVDDAERVWRELHGEILSGHSDVLASKPVTLKAKET